MKKLLAVVLIGFISTAFAEAKIEKICHEIKGKQVCKNVKVHKKFEGTKVPEKAPKK
jgi:hypothetical protein